MGYRGLRISGGLRKLVVTAALAAGFCSAQAQEAKDQAGNAAIADGLSTAAGIAAGAVEMNPLGPIMAIGMKVVAMKYVESLPDVEQPKGYATMASVWSGAAANNVCIAASILTGGSFAPACIAIGVAWGMKTWNDTEYERQFWEGCAMLRVYAEKPDLPCIYTAPQPQVIVTEVDPSQLIVTEVGPQQTAQALVAP